MMYTRNWPLAALFGLLCCAYGAIVIHLYIIQISHTHKYIQLGQRQYHITVTKRPERAAIYDRHGVILAMNKNAVAAFVTPYKLHTPERTRLFIKSNFPEAYKRLEAQPNSSFLYIKRKLTEYELEMIAQENLEDIKLLHEPSRFYPHPTVAQIIGFTDIDNKGIAGIEQMYDMHLSGSPTTYQVERDARSGRYYFARQTTQEGVSSLPINLTIDAHLQFLVTEHLYKTMERTQAKSAGAIIVDPATGNILTLASVPSFDPENISVQQTDYISSPLLVHAYELGSVIKPFCALAALAENCVTMDELIDCKNVATATIGGRKVNTTRSSVRGIVSFKEVISSSNNIGIAQVATRLGSRLYDHYIKLGFGARTNVGYPAEHVGKVNHPKNWSLQSLLSLSYGYEISATMTQLARAFCIIARNGWDVQLNLVASHQDNAPASTRIYPPEVIEQVQELLRLTAQKGTAQRTQLPGYDVLSKTGTANLIEQGQYNPDKNLFTIGGIVQKGSYQRVIIVYVKETNQKNVYASTIAAPLFAAVARTMVIHEKAF